METADELTRLTARRRGRPTTLLAALVLVIGVGGYLVGYTLGVPRFPGTGHPNRLQAELADPSQLAAEAAPNLQRAQSAVAGSSPSADGSPAASANPGAGAGAALEPRPGTPAAPGDGQGDAVAPATGPDQAGRTLAGGAATGRPVLQFVYFVEQDQAIDPGAVPLIDHQAQLLQRFWFDQFGGTFAVADQVVVIRGDHPAAWYDTTPGNDDPRWNRLANVTAETRARLGLDADDTSVRLVVYPAARLDGRVGANRYAGAVMDGDDIGCISGEVVTVPYSADYPANCLPTVAHELGHVFGLSHSGPDQDCMQFGFYQYVSGVKGCQFSDPNRIQVRSDPANQGWLAARPGDRTPGRSVSR